MVGTAEQSLFFVSVPELSRLCWVAVSLQQDENEPRNKQIQTCRELVLLYSDILACPALDSFSEITLIMATSFFKKGIIQAYGQRHNLQVSGPRCVLPGLLQCCVSYSLTCRLAPFWNKAGAFLISGQNFLTENGRMSAVCMQFSTCEKQLCVSVETNTVRLSPTRLEDFDIPSMVLKNFRSHSDAVISVYSLGGNPWCYVLPSMKRGQIITISRQLNKDSPFRSYADLQRHWNSLYGYRLPDLSEEEVIYCSVYFKPVGERLFTYPLSCIRLQPVERCPRLHQQDALESFLCDITNTLHSVCGVPVRWSSKPRYHTATLTSSASTQVLSGKAVNLSTQSQTQSSRAVVLTQHPASSSTPHTKPSVGPQPPARPLTSLQPPGSQSCGDQMGRTGSTEGVLNGVTGSSSSTLSQASSFSNISPTPPPPPPPLPSHHPVNRVGPKLVPIFHNQSLKPHVNITLLLANKHKKQQEQPSRGAEERHRVSLPSFRKNRPPTAASSPPATPLAPPLSLFTASFSSSLSSSTSSAALPPPPVVPLFARRPKSNRVSHAHSRPNPNPNPLSNLRPSPNPRSTANPIPNPLSHPRPSLYPRPNPNPSPLSNPRPSPNHRPNPSPNSDPRSRANPTPTISKPRPSFNPRPTANPSPISDPRSRPNFAPKSGSSPIPNSISRQGAALVSRAEPRQDGGPQNAPPRALVPSDIPSNRGGDVFESKPKRPRPAVQDLDVEIMARNNQLSKVNAVTLLAWLRGRGMSVRAKDKKEQLMLRVMSCLAEA